MTTCRWGLALVSGFVAHAQAQAQPSLQLQDGDRVAFIGDTLLERDQQYGFLETELILRFPETNVIFRNFAWSGDTPVGVSRAGFDAPSAGWDRLKEQIEAYQPTVVFVGYGMANSLESGDDLAGFERELNRLLDGLESWTPDHSPRLALLAPNWHEKHPAPLPDPAAHNALLEKYSSSVKSVAQDRKAIFVPVFSALRDAKMAKMKVNPDQSFYWTDNGIHLNEQGAYQWSKVVLKALGLEALDRNIPMAQYEAVRYGAIQKNRLFFYKWRPQNMTYLFGFRKHEQGQNAKEIPMFSPLIESWEKAMRKVASQPWDADAWAVVRESLEGKPTAEMLGDVKIPDPTQDKPNFILPPGMKIELYAQNPLLSKPIQMNFDPQGRLWVATSSVYPQIQPGEKQDDKILVLEDVDKDGVAEKSTIFAEGLLIPTGVEPGDGGVYVGQSTQLLHFKDLDGDLKADEKRVVLSGFGTEDTHHILHTLRWGHDGQLYFNQSIYIHSHLETPNELVRLNSGGIFNLRPATMELEVFLKGFCNPWGHHFDTYGQSFATDGAGYQGVSHGVKGAMYFTYAGARRILDSVSPGNYPKFCGLEVLESEHFPVEWQGSVITCDFRAHRIVRFAISENESSYLAQEQEDVLRSDDVTFRPIDVKLGPDGALYIADWSNPIIQHGEVDFRDPRRDKVMGRIWRVTMEGSDLNPVLDFPSMTNRQLLDTLNSKNNYDRQRARRVLTERGAKSVDGALTDWIAGVTCDDEQTLLEGLWIYQSLDQPNTGLLEKLLHAEDGRIRAAAVRVLSFWLDEVGEEKALRWLSHLVEDEFPRVRLESIRTLSRIETGESAALALKVLDHPMDRTLDYALWLTINDLSQPWVEAMVSGAWNPFEPGHEKYLEFALNSLETAQSQRALALLVERSGFPKDGSGSLIEWIGRSGAASELRTLWNQWKQNGFDESVSPRALTALAEAARLRSLQPEGGLQGADVEALRKAFSRLDSSSSDTVVAGLNLMSQWKLVGLLDVGLKVLKSESSTEAMKIAAIRSLAQIGGDANQTLGALKGVVRSGSAAAVKIQAMESSLSVDASIGAKLALALLEGAESDADLTRIWRSALSVKGAGAAIANALPETGIDLDLARIGLRVTREGGKPDSSLEARLLTGSGIDESAIILTAKELKELTQWAVERGDPVKGERLYRNPNLACVTCHAIGGVGGKFGPDLTSIGASAPADYLTESLFFPSRKIKEGYHGWSIVTFDGQIVNGVLVRETNEELILRNAANDLVAVAKEDITEREMLETSLMPGGLMGSMKREEQADMIRFLSELGKPGAYDASKVNVARLWGLKAIPHTQEQFGASQLKLDDLDPKQWDITQSWTDGSLFAEALNKPLERRRHQSIVGYYAATRLETPQATEVTLHLEMDEGRLVGLIVDGQEVEVGDDHLAKVSLGAGVHTIAVSLDARRLPNRLKLTSSSGAFVGN